MVLRIVRKSAVRTVGFDKGGFYMFVCPASAECERYS